MSGKIMVVPPQEFEKAMIKLLAKFGDETYNICRDAARSAGRGAVTDLKASPPSKTGKYARGWSHKAETNGFTQYAEIVYNRGKQASLTHLMEYPHDTGHGGKYPSKVDYTGNLARVEEQYTRQFVEEIMSKL